MALTVVISHLLPLDSIKLGRFITSIDYPYHVGYHDPPAAEPPESIITRRDLYRGRHQSGSNATFGPILTSVFSAGFSKRTKTQIEVTAEQATTYVLNNSDDWFDNAMTIPATRVWIERAIDRGTDIYMVVGFHAITNARIIYKNLHGQDVKGKIAMSLDLPLAVGVGALLGNIGSPSLGGESQGLTGTQSDFTAPGEQICAFQYRRLRHKWLSSSRIDTSRLSKLPRWSSVERGRGDEDGEDDIIEVEATPMDELDGEWDMQEVEGEILCVRSDEAAQD